MTSKEKWIEDEVNIVEERIINERGKTEGRKRREVEVRRKSMLMFVECVVENGKYCG